MNAEERDPLLQKLFSESREELEGKLFAEGFVVKTNKRKQQRFIALAVGLVPLLILIVLFASPLLTVAVQVSEVMTISLFTIGNETIAWFLSPINNLASAFLLLAKLIRMGWKGAVNATYSY